MFRFGECTLSDGSLSTTITSRLLPTEEYSFSAEEGVHHEGSPTECGSELGLKSKKWLWRSSERTQGILILAPERTQYGSYNRRTKYHGNSPHVSYFLMQFRPGKAHGNGFHPRKISSRLCNVLAGVGWPTLHGDIIWLMKCSHPHSHETLWRIKTLERELK